MGCGGGSTIKYKHGMQERKISIKNADTIKRWASGAVARRRFKKLVQSLTIARQKKPLYLKGKLVASEETLFTDAELKDRLDPHKGGKGYFWNTFFRDIGKGRKYQGQWKVDKYKSTWEGLGLVKFPDGSTYQGMTYKGLFHGKGRITHKNGDVYHGEWKEGKACGMGVFIDQNGSMYDGEWLNDQYHGKGTEQWKYNQIKYTGDFVNGQKTGKGKFEFDGNTYDGDFEEGQFHGKGKYQFAESGKVYEGEFEENSINGQGTMTWTDGSTYTGDFVDGKADGFGVKKYADGSAYEGEWKNDMRHTIEQEAKFYNAKTKQRTENFWKNDREVIEGAPHEVPGVGLRKVVRISQGAQRFKRARAMQYTGQHVPDDYVDQAQVDLDVNHYDV